MNSQSLCKGLITRSRIVNGITEDSIIDFGIVCDKLLPYVERFLVDEKKEYPLSNFSKKKRALHSDHNALITKLNLKYEPQKPIRNVIYNYRDENAMRNFKIKTSETNKFSNVFQTSSNVESKDTFDSTTTHHPPPPGTQCHQYLISY